MTARIPEPVVATPEPQRVATPVPTPKPMQESQAPPVAVAPTPTPKPAEPTLDLATVAASPALWPPAISLVQPFPFPVVIDGRVVGQATAPVGTMLRLVRVNGQQLEVEFQKGRHIIPASTTDLVPRALVILKIGRPEPTAPLVAPVAPVAAMTPRVPMIPAPPTQTPEKADAIKLAKQIVVEPVAKLQTTMNPDYYSKTDNFSLKLKVTNSDARNPVDNLKVEIYIFGESQKDPELLKMLAVEEFTFSLPGRGFFEKKTKDVKTTYYNSGSYRSGIKFGVWFLRVRNSAGDTVMVKTSSPVLQKIADKAIGLKEGKTYTRKTLEESKTTVF